MICCSLRIPHAHYPAWLRMGDSIERCRCGHHPRRMTIEALLTAWGNVR